MMFLASYTLIVTYYVSSSVEFPLTALDVHKALDFKVYRILDLQIGTIQPAVLMKDRRC